MNFLAHIFLSCSDEASLMGNFLTDYLTKKQAEALPLDWQVGVDLHRKIDQFTDRHPAVLEQVTRLRPYHARYAPVIVDIFYDYFLIKNWNHFTAEPFSAFCENVYGILIRNLDQVPSPIQPRVQSMVKGSWLSSYGEKAGILYAIDRMSSRTSRPEWLANAAESFQNEYDSLDQSFMAFFPELIEEIDCLC
ncbi:MAG: ACP phosphodiesterase [Saprospiraceae bacterium]